MKHLLGSAVFRSVIPVVALAIAVKMAFHFLGWEALTVNPLFSGIIAANVFLMGFLISGVLADYKESERIPGEMAVSIAALRDEISIMGRGKGREESLRGLDHLIVFTETLKEWFFKRKNTRDLTECLEAFNEHFFQFEPLTQANFIVRMKQEQSNLRRLVIRAHTVRETSFVISGYVIAEATTFLVMIGLILSKIEPFYESLFFTFVISFLLNFLLGLIRHLDNPFAYYEKESVENVSLKPIEDILRELKEERPVA